MRALLQRRQAGLLTWWSLSALTAVQGSSALAATMPIMHDDARDLMEIDPKKFSRPTEINKKWMPLTPGKQLVYEGHTVEDRKRIPHRVVYTVTDLLKIINGITTVVVHDLDISNGYMEEQELTFFAQDNDGNVWHLGQMREAYE